jgi:hypothetical protein
MKIDLKVILIVILGIALLMTNTCSNDTKKNEIVKIEGKRYELLKTVIDTQYVYIEKIVKKSGELIYRDTTIYVTIPMSIDTVNIINDFFAKNVYSDTLLIGDSLGTVVILDTIQRNTIKHRIYNVNFNQLVISSERTVMPKPKNEFYVGFEGQINKPNIINSLGLNLTMRSKTEKLYSVGLGISNTGHAQSNPYVGFGLQWRLKTKK